MKIKVTPSFYLLLAFGVIMIPIEWLFAWLTAAAVHEICHILSMMCLGFRPEKISLQGGGAIIFSHGMRGLRLSVCALAGPCGGLLLMCFFRIAPRLAFCGVIQSAYNLLPVRSLDGELILRGIAEQILPEQSIEKLLRITENIILALLVISGLYAYMKLRLGLFPLIVVGALLFKNKKIPCKQTFCKLQ